MQAEETTVAEVEASAKEDTAGKAALLVIFIPITTSNSRRAIYERFIITYAFTQ